MRSTSPSEGKTLEPIAEGVLRVGMVGGCVAGLAEGAAGSAVLAEHAATNHVKTI
jgi:hypothetical protein